MSLAPTINIDRTLPAILRHALRLGAATAVIGAVAVTGLCAASGRATAEPRTIEGTWSGGGVVRAASGNEEKARCRAHVQRISNDLFGIDAVCATSSIRISQTAKVRRVSATQFAGRFYNEEYNISGKMTLTATDDTLHASLSAENGSASFSLRR